MKKIYFFTGMLFFAVIFISSCSLEPGPEKTLKIFVKSVMESKLDEVWDLLSYEDQKEYEKKVVEPTKERLKAITPADKKNLKHPELGVSVQNILNMTARDFFVFQMEKKGGREELLKKLNPDTLRVEKVSIHENVAKLKIREKKEELTMVKERGRWRICLF